jgi:hypothetical protein
MQRTKNVKSFDNFQNVYSLPSQNQIYQPLDERSNNSLFNIVTAISIILHSTTDQAKTDKSISKILSRVSLC